MWEPQPLTTLRASKACRGENLIIIIIIIIIINFNVAWIEYEFIKFVF
jgi:hypothetical protein